MKKRIALLLCAAMVVSILAACGGDKKETTAAGGTNETKASGETQAGQETKAEGNDTAGVPAHKDTLIIGSAADINNLDLQGQQDQVNNIVIKNTHQKLIFFTNDGELVPSLATSWEYTDDTHIQMKLRDDVYFNDGNKTPMTAEDVKFTMDMAMDSMVASNLAGLVETKVIDDYTVEFTLESYNNEFIVNFANEPLSIQSKAAYDSGMDKPYLIGTGPYKFDEWVEGEYCRIVKVDDYWGSDLTDPDFLKPGISEAIEFRPYIEASSRVIALQAGEIDVCIDPPINELQYLEEDENITVFEKPGSRLFYFAFNVEKSPWDNQTLRQAVACAIDRDAVLEAAVYGKGTPQTTILNRGLWGFYDDMEGFPHDLDRAKSLMEEAGYKDGGIDTTLSFATGAPYEQIATVIQANLQDIGIKVTLVPLETATLKETCVEGNQELFLWRWNEDTKCDYVYRDLFYTDSGSNYHHYADSHADELIDFVATEKDQDKRMEYGIELQEYLVDACPQVPLYIANLVIAYNKNLKGEYLFGGGNHDWAHAYIAE